MKAAENDIRAWLHKSCNQESATVWHTQT